MGYCPFAISMMAGLALFSVHRLLRHLFGSLSGPKNTTTPKEKGHNCIYHTFRRMIGFPVPIVPDEQLAQAQPP